jgi:hypothetical protein
MEFDIKEFAEEFKKTVDWMLKGKHAKQIMNDLRIFKNSKDILEKDSDSPDALRLLIKLIKSKGWRLNLPGDFDNKIDGFLKKHGRKLRTSTAKTDLIKLVGNDRKENIEQLIKFPTIEKFTKHLYYLATQGQTVVLGEKGRDNYLRDFGYWDRIPIDRIEMRSIIRTGIYHVCSTGEERDPLEKSSLHDTLAQFSSTYLKGKMVGDIDLGNAPGIVDTFIWSYSAEERYQICIKNPECEECNLNRTCLYGIFKTP